MGFEPPDGYPGEYVLSLNKSLYGLKQVAFTWLECLKEGLESRDFFQSSVDPCVFYKEGILILVYVDDCTVISLEEKAIIDFNPSLKDGPEEFNMTEKGDIKAYLGIDITIRPDISISVHQRFV